MHAPSYRSYGEHDRTQPPHRARRDNTRQDVRGHHALELDLVGFEMFGNAPESQLNVTLLPLVPPHVASTSAIHQNASPSTRVTLSDDPYHSTGRPRAEPAEAQYTGSPSSYRSSSTVEDFSLHLSSSPLVQHTHDSAREVRNRDDLTSPTEMHVERVERSADHQVAGVMGGNTGRGWSWFRSCKKALKLRRTQERKTNRGDEGKAMSHSYPHRQHAHSDTENVTDCTDANFHRSARIRKGISGSWFGGAVHYSRNYRPANDPPKLGNGVLSALLALYHHNHYHDEERSVSGESTSSNAGNEDNALPEPHRPWLSNQDDVHSDSASSIIGYMQQTPISAAPTTAAPLASAGTFSSAIVPQHPILAPIIERPSFNPVRYSIDEVSKVASTASNIVTQTPRRACGFDSVAEGTKEERERKDTPPDTLASVIVVSPTTGSDRFKIKEKTGYVNPVSVPVQRKWSGRLKHLSTSVHMSPSHLRSLSSSRYPFAKEDTPKAERAGGVWMDEFGNEEGEALHVKERERKVTKKKRTKERLCKRRKAEVYITKHVAEILQRQEFILKLTRAMMMFGGPSHRLASQIQSTGHALNLDLSCMYLPDVMLISFEDSGTGTSNIKFIRQGNALDLEKLQDAHSLYWNVIHDNMSVSGASTLLDVLMRKKPLYNFAELTFIGAICSASVCSLSFSGSFIDSLVSAPLGGLLVAVQLICVRNELYTNVFEILTATLLSFLSAALASTTRFCFSAVASSSVVLILPGYVVLSGTLELSSRSLVAGAVRLCFAGMYSLFLGFGLAVGAEMYEKIVGVSIVGPVDYMCLDSHDPSGPWWQQTPSIWWALLTVPLYSLFSGMWLMAPWCRKEMAISIAIASLGWVTNHFVSINFLNQGDISAAVGAFAITFASSMYGCFFDGNSLVVMITGILFQVPSGLGNGGLLTFVSNQTSGSPSTYMSGFQTALQLISVAVGVTVGVGVALVIMHPVQRRRRTRGLFGL